MRLYLAGPMSGMPDLNRGAAAHGKAQLERYGYTVISPWDFVQNVDNDGSGGGPEVLAYYLRHDLHQLADTDGVALLDGYRTSKGANIEIFVATLLNLPVRHVDSWVTHALYYDLDLSKYTAEDNPAPDFGLLFAHWEGLR